MAHALHDLLEVQNRTEVIGDELLDTLIKRVAFEGVTGPVDFHDASADPARLYHGDRRVGITYVLLNYVDSVQGLLTVGLWRPCGAGCGWLERWSPTPGVGLTYSTADNSRPQQSGPPRVTMVRLGVLLPMFGTAVSGYTSHSTWAPLAGAYLAFRELNNKTDGVLDHLLPRTQLIYAYYDSKCDSSQGLAGSVHLTRNAFGQGVAAIIGAGCSGGSEPSAQVAALESIPIVSPSSLSPTLSDGKAYPAFLRVVPSDAFATTALVDVLKHLFAYSSVALVHSTDAYGAGGASAMQQASSEAGLRLSAVVSFPENAIDIVEEAGQLRKSAARVVVLFSQTQDGSNFVRAAYDAGAVGHGYMWLSGS
eukprot:5072815-Prymnesium_polylepis.2